MVIEIQQSFLNRLIRFIHKTKIDTRRTYYCRQDKVASFLEVSPVTLSRQLNNQVIDVSFLHRYLVAAGLITKNVPCPKLDTFDVYLKLLPIESQKRIMKELIND